MLGTRAANLALCHMDSSSICIHGQGHGCHLYYFIPCSILSYIHMLLHFFYLELNELTIDWHISWGRSVDVV